MAKKKTTKKKKVKISGDEKEELKAEGELPKKSVRESENRQLIWFFVVIGVIFLSFLVPYFYFESLKTFHYGGVDWNIDDSDKFITFYHSEFPALNGANLNYNVYLRHDPRENDVEAIGEFNAFKYGGYFSFSEEVNTCGGQVFRASADMINFVKMGVGVGNMDNSALTPEFGEDSGLPFVNCFTHPDRTVVVLRMGEPSVIQSEINPYCYVISIEDCDDFAPIEKFITKTIDDSTRD